MRVGLFPESETAPASGAASSDSPRNHPRFHRQQTLALQLFAGELTGATDSFCLLPDSPLGRLFIVAAELHLAEETFALHLPLQRLEGLIDIVVADENLHVVFLFKPTGDRPNSQGAWATGGYPQTLPITTLSLSRTQMFHSDEPIQHSVVYR